MITNKDIRMMQNLVVPSYQEVGFDLKPKRVCTSCCAMNQIIAKNGTPFLELEKIVNDSKRESQLDWSRFRQGGPKTLFCMTVFPHEFNLEENLKQLGFEMIKDGLSRRTGYPPGKIRMWMLNW